MFILICCCYFIQWVSLSFFLLLFINIIDRLSAASNLEMNWKKNFNWNQSKTLLNWDCDNQSLVNFAQRNANCFDQPNYTTTKYEFHAKNYNSNLIEAEKQNYFQYLNEQTGLFLCCVLCWGLEHILFCRK